MDPRRVKTPWLKWLGHSPTGELVVKWSTAPQPYTLEIAKRHKDLLETQGVPVEVYSLVPVEPD